MAENGNDNEMDYNDEPVSPKQEARSPSRSPSRSSRSDDDDSYSDSDSDGSTRRKKSKKHSKVKKEAKSSRRRRRSRATSDEDSASDRSRSRSSRSASRSRSPPKRRRSRDRHGNPIVRLADRKKERRQRSSSRDSSTPRGKVNIYERPHGPRTGIGYPKANTFEIRFVIPSKIAGSVIGKGGDLVQQLRVKYDCDIGVPNSEKSIDRVVIVRGQSIKKVIDCTCSIADYPLKKEMGRGLNLQSENSQLRLLLHQSICGNVIGKGGQLIHEIRTEAGTDVHMYNEVCPKSSDRICRITGKISEIREALAMIFKYTGDNHCRGRENDYEAKNSTGNEKGRDYGGWRLSEVRHMGAPEHRDDYTHLTDRRGKDKKYDSRDNVKKYDRHGNLRSENKTSRKRRSHRSDSESSADNNGSTSRHRSRSTDKKKRRRRSSSHEDSRSRSRRDRDRGDRKDRRKEKSKREKERRNYDDAPVYEGPNSSGPNRLDRKKEHPLTALDLKRLQDKENKKVKTERMRDLIG